MKREKPKGLERGKFWHRLFGHSHMLLAAYGPAAIIFCCEAADCRGFVTIKTARDYSKRLMAVPVEGE